MKVTLSVFCILILASLNVNADSEGTINAVSVGLVGDNNCDYNTIQAAINGGHDEIRIVDYNNQTFEENIEITNQSIELKGGFANCNAANNDNPLRLLTIIDGVTGTVFDVDNDSNSYTFKMSNIIVQGGTQDMFNSGGGLIITGTDTQATFENVAIANNEGTGLIASEISSILLKDTRINDNSNQNGDGGGIYCEASTIVIAGASVIRANHAIADTFLSGVPNNGGRGGGVFATDGCHFTFYSGPNHPNTGSAGILSNSADAEGGGIYAETGSKISLLGTEVQIGNELFGDTQYPLNVLINNSGSNGGGIYLRGNNTELTASGVSIRQNSATANGGGIYVESDAIAAITRYPGGCWNNNKCNFFYLNSSGTNDGTGGGIYAGGAQLAVGNAWFEENLADYGSAIAVVASTATIEGNVFYKNDAGAGYDADSTILNTFNANSTLAYNTIVNNNPAVASIDHTFNSNLTQAGNIIYDLGSTSLNTDGTGSNTNHCLYVNESSAITGTNIITNTTDPFVDSQNNDFHINSDALRDVCDTSLYTPSLFDFDYQPRGFDDPVDEVDGLFDIGADEDYSSDVIFKDGFGQ
jgi:predicted outer membrane repeat protein